jgi:hypothetical protein
MRWLFALTFVAACSDSSGPARPIDASIDGAADPCLACGPDQICVARYDGTCHGQAICVARTIDCPSNTCTAGCEAAYCMPSYQCRTRAPCGGESPRAFTCYGP